MNLFLRTFLVFVCLLLFLTNSPAQRADADPATYEELYDAPDQINKLFLQFQPISGEFWKSNPNIGFGIEATYFIKKVARIRAAFRRPYADQFDMYRYNGRVNSSLDNEVTPYKYFELGGTYHIKDFTSNTETKLPLYKKSYRGARWAARVPDRIPVACTLRQIIGVRTGGFFFEHASDLKMITQRQGISYADIIAVDGSGSLPETFTNTDTGLEDKVLAFGNISVPGIYVGGAMSWIKNVAVDPDNHEKVADDKILTAYADILVSPWVKAENVYLNGLEYSVENIKTNMIGGRIGIDGKYNRTLSWGYGGEVGFKPGFGKGGFFALIKISLPVYSTNLEYDVEAFAK